MLHEIDRFIVAQSTADESLKAQALASIAEGLKGGQGKFVQSRLCEEHELSHPWRAKQRQARTQAAKVAGVCART